VNLEEFRKSKVWTKIFCKKSRERKNARTFLHGRGGLKEIKKKSVKSGKLIKNEKMQKVDGKCVGELKDVCSGVSKVAI
jgi:hypothetical protein